MQPYPGYDPYQQYSQEYQQYPQEYQQYPEYQQYEHYEQYQQEPSYVPPYQSDGSTPPPVAYQPPPQPPSNTTGLLAMIFGIVAVPTSCCFLGLPLGVAASVLAGVSLRKVAEGRATNRGMALTGLVCGVVGIVVTIGLITLGIITPSDPIGYTG